MKEDKKITPKIEYSIDGNDVLRTDTEKDISLKVATYDKKNGLLSIVPGLRNYQGPVQRFLSTLGLPYRHTDSFNKSGAPAMSAAEGDKTPAYVRWMADKHPEEFVARYKVTQLYTKTGKESRAFTDPDDIVSYRDIAFYRLEQGLGFDFAKVANGDQVLIADRKTCMTELYDRFLNETMEIVEC